MIKRFALAFVLSLSLMVPAVASATSPAPVASYRLIDNYSFSYQVGTSNAREVTFTIQSMSDAMCDSATYTIDYGDGATSAVSPSCFDNLAVDVQTASHTYSDASTYTATFKRNGQVLESVTVNTKDAIQNSLFAATTTGNVPLSVTFTAAAASGAGGADGMVNVSFGDTSSTMSLPFADDGTAVFQHTYTIPGSYVVKLQEGSTVLKSVSIFARVAGDVNENDIGKPTCPNITVQLQTGDTDATTGGQVSKLQQFLTDFFQLDGSLVVGTFGPQTENYVKQFQTFNGIQAVGSVGPMTRQAISAACSGPSDVYPLTATPASGNSPLTVDLAYGDPNQHQTYNIDFGDGQSAAMVYTIGTDCSGAGCAPRYDAPHTYTKNGMYTAKVTTVIDPCNGDAACTTPAQVYELATTSVTVGAISGGDTTYPVIIGTLDKHGAITDWGEFSDVAPDTATYTVGASTPRDVRTYIGFSNCPSCSATPKKQRFKMVNLQPGKTYSIVVYPGYTSSAITYTATIVDGQASFTYSSQKNIGPQASFPADVYEKGSSPWTIPFVAQSASVTIELGNAATSGSNYLHFDQIQLLATAGNANGCVVITHNLYADISDADVGGDVTTLQKFLVAGGYLVMPADASYGFFGPATEAAVQAYQSAAGIVSSGTPDTTGYGYVGNKTRAALAANCTSTPTPQSALSATPTSGSAPLAVHFSGSTSGTHYTLDFGDGTQPVTAYQVIDCPASNTTCNSNPMVTVSQDHTYTQKGTFVAQLMRPSPSVTCAGVSYDPSDPLSFINMGTSDNCSNGTTDVTVGQVTISVN